MKKKKYCIALLVVFAVLFSAAACAKRKHSTKSDIPTASHTTTAACESKSTDNAETYLPESQTTISENTTKKADTAAAATPPKTVLPGTTVKTTTPAPQTAQTAKQRAGTARTNATTEKRTKPVATARTSAYPHTAKSAAKETAASVTARTQTRQTQANTTTTAPAGIVHIIVNGRHAAEYGIGNIPPNGIMLDAKVPYFTGDTALNALKRALQANHMDFEESHGYIKAIGGLHEKDCGGSSGWMYAVNAETPMASADKYAVSPNDTVVFYYVTQYGDTV